MCFRPPFVDERTTYDHPAGMEIVMPALGILRARNVETPPAKDAGASRGIRTVEIEVAGKGLRVLVGKFSEAVEGGVYPSGTVIGYVGSVGVWVEPYTVSTAPVGA